MTNNNIKISNYVLIGALTAMAINHIDKVYIPLKQSIATGHTAEMWIYSSELLAFFISLAALLVAINSVGRGRFFTPSNVRCFLIMAGSMMLPPITKTLGRFFVGTPDWIAFPMSIEVWVAAALFLALIANIFEYGVKLQKEQDLTI